MLPLQAGGIRLWRAAEQFRQWSLSGALCVSLLLGAVLGQSTLAVAQQSTPAPEPNFFPATGYRISSPELLDYFLHHGGVRTFGYPVSNEFPLLGQRVQLFQRAMLQVAADGSVAPADILRSDILPVTHIDGLSLPAVDPDLVASAPTPDSADYDVQALAFVNLYVPDEWNGLPVNFQQAFLNTVSCADASGGDECDSSQLPGLDLQMWGLPTSLPTSDPLNPDFVYQRFQRGIMHFSRTTGMTQGLLLGDWLKRVMIGVDLSPDLNPEVRQSRLYAQFAPSRPLALDRPDALPDTSLAQAFRNESLMAAGQSLGQVEPTLPANVAQTATAVAMTATSVSATQAALTGTQGQQTSTAAALTATAAATGTAAAAQLNVTPSPTPAVIVSTIPVVNVGCLGDEQLWFVPRKPNVGVHVAISVTSQRHHDVRAMALGGPLDPGPVTEKVGPLGFIWTWTVAPTVEAFYQWTFFADGLRPCITSGFNAFASIGATETPTITPIPSNTPSTLTATPTGTPVPIPSITAASATGTCGSVITINGTNFGSPPSNFGTSAQLLGGPPGSGTPVLLSLIGGSNTQLTATLPSSGLVAGNNFNLVVVNNGGASNTVPFTVTACGAAAETATPTPATPTVSSVSPSSAPCGNTFTITGTNFGSAQNPVSARAQLVNGPSGTVDLTLTNTASTQLTVRVPNNLPAGSVKPGQYGVQVLTDGGSSGTNVSFTVVTGC
jgi:IPT/TIG domain